MRKSIGILCMLLGILLVLGAYGLLISNQQEDQDAEVFVDELVPLLREEISQAQQSATETTLPQDNIPKELLNPEDLIMTEKMINGYAYIGYLTIPELKLELPVMSGWDSRRLQKSPCRYTGTLKGEDLVIMAHNFKSHFGYLARLSEGSVVQFMDMDGNLWNYSVVAKDILPAEAVEEMTAGEYDLTLFTCSTNRSQRITVRCNFTES